MSCHVMTVTSTVLPNCVFGRDCLSQPAVGTSSCGSSSNSSSSNSSSSNSTPFPPQRLYHATGHACTSYGTEKINTNGGKHGGVFPSRGTSRRFRNRSGTTGDDSICYTTSSLRCRVDFWNSGEGARCSTVSNKRYSTHGASPTGRESALPDPQRQGRSKP